MAKAGMLDIASVTADVVGRSGLGQDFDAEDMDSKVDADDEIVGDGGSRESGGGVSYGEEEDENGDELEFDDFASSSEESDAARANWSTGRCPQPDCSSRGTSSGCFVKGRRYERTGITIATTDASHLRGGCPLETLDFSLSING
jgi:hypothetical protein